MKELFDALGFGCMVATPIMLVIVYGWLRSEIRSLRIPLELQDDEADPERVKEAAEAWRRDTL